VSRVLSKVLGPIDHEPLASEEVDSIWNAFRIDFFASALLEILIVLEAKTVFDAGLKHFSRLLTQWRVLIMVRLKVPLPNVLDSL
jgi:hypothetical protein